MKDGRQSPTMIWECRALMTDLILLVYQQLSCIVEGLGKAAYVLTNALHKVIKLSLILHRSAPSELLSRRVGQA